MYGLLKKVILKVLKTPDEPEAPSGDEASLKVFRAAPAYFKYRLLGWAFGRVVMFGITVAVVLGLVAGGAAGAQDEPLLGVVFIALAVFVAVVAAVNLFLSYAVVRLDYEMRWYMVTDRSLRIREGVYNVREMTMTFANIQNIAVNQGPIQRLFGIADLKVETAGGGMVNPQAQGQGQHFGMHIGFFRGVDNAQEIRDLMLARLKQLRDSGLGDEDDTEQAVETNIDALDVLTAIRDEARAMRSAVEPHRWEL